jgi:hypothetical protein
MANARRLPDLAGEVRRSGGDCEQRWGVRSLVGGLGGLGEVGKTFGAGGRAYRASVCGGWGACEGATFGDG